MLILLLLICDYNDSILKRSHRLGFLELVLVEILLCLLHVLPLISLILNITRPILSHLTF